MKRYILLFAIVLSSCSTHSTAPELTPPPAHPFPSTFRQVTVLFQDIPEYSYYEHSVWGTGIPGYLGGDTTIIDTGTGPVSDGWTFDFDTSTFTQSGDTIRGHGTDASTGGAFTVILVADQNSGVLDYLLLGYYTSGGTASDGGSDSYGVQCKNIAYEADTSNQIVATMTGQQLQQGVIYLGTSSSDQTRNSSDDNETKYNGGSFGNTSLTIRFKQQ